MFNFGHLFAEPLIFLLPQKVIPVKFGQDNSPPSHTTRG